MGAKGETRTKAAKVAAERFAARLSAVGPVAARGMFGGFGIFVDGVMFGLVNRKGELHLRVDDTTRADYEEVGSTSHGKMPYYTVPESVLEDDENLEAWASEAAAIARAAKQK